MPGIWTKHGTTIQYGTVTLYSDNVGFPRNKMLNSNLADLCIPQGQKPTMADQPCWHAVWVALFCKTFADEFSCDYQVANSRTTYCCKMTYIYFSIEVGVPHDIFSVSCWVSNPCARDGCSTPGTGLTRWMLKHCVSWLIGAPTLVLCVATMLSWAWLVYPHYWRVPISHQCSWIQYPHFNLWDHKWNMLAATPLLLFIATLFTAKTCHKSSRSLFLGWGLSHLISWLQVFTWSCGVPLKVSTSGNLHCPGSCVYLPYVRFESFDMLCHWL